jgi:poly-gamma-glutamate capsule biosynthesis protein CapA/YwtB (metallophosphatase superfamily)
LRRRRLAALAVVVAAVAGGAVLAVLKLTGGADPAQAAASPRAQTSVPAPSATPAVARAPASATVSIAVVGDVVMGTTGSLPPDGGRTFFDAVDQYLQRGLVLGNLEGTLSTGRGSKCGAGSANCFAFQMPPSYAKWLKRAGFRIMNLANNHAFDYGQHGLQQTEAALRNHGLAYTGPPGRITVLTANGVRVAFLGFSSYPWANDLTDIAHARKLVANAAGKADLVVVMLHGGAEGSDKTHVPKGTEYFLGENRGNLRAFSHAVVQSGADLVVGSGPHVLRGMEWYRGRLIAYSLGNFAGYKVLSTSGVLGISGILRVTLHGNGAWGGGTLTATDLVGGGLPAPDRSGRADDLVRRLSRADFGGRAIRIASNGSLSPPSG